MEMYLEEMSPSFYGKSYTESALYVITLSITTQFQLCSICFKLRVMLLAVEMKRIDENGNTRMVVDIVPCDNCVIHHGSRAVIVCMSSEDANRSV